MKKVVKSFLVMTMVMAMMLSFTTVVFADPPPLSITAPEDLTVYDNEASAVTLFEHADYSGYSVNLAVGKYRLNDLINKGMLNDDISSVKVKSGYKVTLYVDDNFEGGKLEKTKDVKNFENDYYWDVYTLRDFNDEISSVKVEKKIDKISLGKVTAPGANITNDAPEYFPAGSTTVTWKAKRGSEKVTDAQKVTVIVDTENPTLTSVSIASNNANSSYAKVGDIVTLAFTASEAIKTPSVKISGFNTPAVKGSGNTYTASYTMQGTDSEGVIPFTINFADLAGNQGTTVSLTTNSSSVTFDKTAPIITLGGTSPVTVEVGSTYTDAGATVTDNSGETITPVMTGDVDTSKLGTYTVTYNAEDSSGNEAVPVSRTVNVVDTTPPALTEPADITLEATKSAATVYQHIEYNQRPDETNGYSINLELGEYTLSQLEDKGMENNDISSLKVAPGYKVILFEHDNFIGRSIDKTSDYLDFRTDNFNDIVSSIIVTVDIGEATTEDASDEIKNDAPETFPYGTTTVTWTATDTNGNSITEEQLIIISDTTKPVITLKGDAKVNLEVGDAYTDEGATAEDSFDGDITDDIIIDASNVDTSTIGEYTVIYDVSDSSGNAADTVARAVYVNDTIKPIIKLNGKAIVELEIGDAYVEDGATAEDNVDGDITDDIIIDASNVDTSTVGEYTVTYDVSDSSGNTADTVARAVYVSEESNGPILVTAVSVFPKTLALKVGKTSALTAEIEPDDAACQHVIWSSNKESVATVDEDGIVTAVAPGTAIITVTTEDGEKTDTCTLIVSESEPVSVFLKDIELSEGTLTPAFDSETTNYKTKVKSSVRNITVTAILGEEFLPAVVDSVYDDVYDKEAAPTAIIKIQGIKTASGEESAPIKLKIGKNTITVDVTIGENTQVYTIVVTRRAPAGDSGTTTISRPAPAAMEDTPAPAALEEPMFTDLDDFGWARDKIEALAKKGIVKGKEPGLFKPNDKVTRAEFAEMAVNMLGLKDETNTSRFSDVKSGDWFFTAVNAADNAGIILGYPEGDFKPNDLITRQDISLIVKRILVKFKGVTVPEDVQKYLTFKDNGKIAKYAQEGVATSVMKSIVNGYSDGTFKPIPNTTRAESAVVIYNIMELK